MGGGGTTGAVPPRRLLLGREERADLGDERVLIGESAGLLLRVDVAAVDANLEDATRTGLEDEATELVLVVVRDLLRQTDGFGQVPSSGAVLDLELHAIPSYWLRA